MGWRLWRLYYRDELNLVRAIAIVLAILVLLAGGLVWLIRPIGPAVTVHGEVEALGFHETKFGSRPTASVSVDGRVIRVDLRAGFDCTVGDRITVRRRSTRWGFLYGVGRNPRPCSRDKASFRH